MVVVGGVEAVGVGREECFGFSGIIDTPETRCLSLLGDGLWWTDSLLMDALLDGVFQLHDVAASTPMFLRFST
ncbi:hypothetical protein Mapa_008749 [Marchantia paleacea]|nr:hypothetical protein Mapa_008749 [Marchantia paleacea]